MYYVLVLAVTFCQVYMNNPEGLKGAFMAIIIVAAVFLWLEFLQCLQNPRGYLSLPYNYVDLIVYILPLVASAVQIAEIVQNSGNIDAKGNTRAFSFAILVIYLHLVGLVTIWIRSLEAIEQLKPLYLNDALLIWERIAV